MAKIQADVFTIDTLPYLAKMTSDFILKLELRNMRSHGKRLFDDRKWAIKERKKGGY